MSRKPKRETEDFYSKGESIEERKKHATACIRSFFNDRTFFCGGSIPTTLLISENAQRVVMQTQFDDWCFDFIHKECLPLIKVDPSYDEPTVPWTVHALIGLLGEMKKKDIPKEFQPGMLFLYFKLCFGVDIPAPPLLL